MKKVLALAVALAAACRSTEPPATKIATAVDASQTVMRTYRVPPGQEKAVERLLRGNSYPVAAASDKGVADTHFVRLNPQFTGDGYFILTAPTGIQDGVVQLLDELKTRPAASGPTSIETTYWLVLGYPSDKPEIPTQLAAIEPALKGIADLGAMRFEPYETVQMMSLDGDEARATGKRAEIRQTASADQNAIDVRLEIKVTGADDAPRDTIETAVRVKPGQFSVLGEAGFRPKGSGPNDVTPTLFYVVRTRPMT
jgi:hypothetical protein